MPPIGVHSAYLAHKDRRDDRGRYLARESNVYAPNEEIFLRAYLEHVARAQPGTMDMRFEIDLHLRVADESGAELGRAKLHTYAAPSTLLYPVDETQFWNNITAGMSLPDPGRYELTFIFTDMSRAGTPSALIPVRGASEHGRGRGATNKLGTADLGTVSKMICRQTGQMPYNYLIDGSYGVTNAPDQHCSGLCRFDRFDFDCIHRISDWPRICAIAQPMGGFLRGGSRLDPEKPRNVGILDEPELLHGRDVQSAG